MTPDKLREDGSVQRWTSGSVAPNDQGGFVAYGDYLTLQRAHADALEEIERLKVELAEDNGVIAVWRGRTERAESALADAERGAERLKVHAEALNGALANLFALVNGEVPSLLEDDHHYELVANALAAYRADKGE